MSTDSDDGTNASSTDATDDSGGGHCSTADSDGEVAEEIAVISFERKLDTAEEIVEEIGDRYESIDVIGTTATCSPSIGASTTASSD